MMKPSLIRAGIAVLGCLTALAAGNRLRQEWVIGRLASARDRSTSAKFRSTEERQAWLRRNREFCSLWMQRHTRDVTPDLRPFLGEPGPMTLRQRAARALGRLESPTGEAALAEVLDRTSGEAGEQSPLGVPLHTLRLALARARSRGLPGTGRVGTIMRGVGLQTDDMMLLSQKVNDPSVVDGSAGTPAAELLAELVDVLYTMRKRGENIDAFTQRLLLTRGQDLKLQGAGLPRDQEVNLILDYLSQRDRLTGDDYDLALGHLVGLGPQAHQLILLRLQEMYERPRDYRRPLGYKILFRCTAVVVQRQALPTLERFAGCTDPQVRGDALTAAQDIRAERSFASFP